MRPYSPYVLILLLIFIIAAYLLNTPHPADRTDEITYREHLELKVNGETITAAEIEQQYQRIPEEVKQTITKDDVLKGIINQTLLLQQAEKKGITTTEEEVETYLEEIKAFNHINNTELEQQITQQGYTIEEYINNLKTYITISKLLDQELNIRNITASDNEVEEYLKQNREFQDILSDNDSELETLVKNSIKRKL
jgi:hypothetical protein